MKKSIIGLIIVVVIIGVYLYIMNGKKSFNENTEKQKIAQVIDSNISWFKNKDFELMFSTVAHDSNFLSVHPTDKIVNGFDQFSDNSEIFKYEGFKYVRHEIKDLKITISHSKDVAWFYCVLDDINTWDGQPASWENVRRTGVLEKRDGNWVLVQQHFSFPTS